MATSDFTEFKDIVDTWVLRRMQIFDEEPYRDGANAEGLRKFVQTQNYLCRKLFTLMERKDTEFWDGVQELAVGCARLATPNAKIYVDGQDRTSEGM